MILPFEGEAVVTTGGAIIVTPILPCSLSKTID